MYKYGPMQKAGGAGKQAGGWTPASLPDLMAWWDSEVNVTGSAPVTSWVDQSSNAFDITPTVTGPKVTSAQTIGSNTYDVIEFDATTNLRTTSASFTQQAGFHAFYVMRWDTNDSFDVFHSFASGAGIQVYVSGGILRMASGSTLSHASGLGTGTWTCVEAFYNADATTYLDVFRAAGRLGSKATGDAGSNTGTGYFLGTSNSDTSPSDISVAEIIISDAQVTGTDRTNLESYITTKYGMTFS
jgi:hypothetical protein